MSPIEHNGNGPMDQKYWRSLDELADTPEFREFVHREFPQGASELDNSWSRRSFLTLMGASLALAGLAGCRRPREHIVPYVKPPEEITVGVPQYYATAMPWGNSAFGLVVESHEGRPTKIEGNAKHPVSRGKSHPWIQAQILDLYDPDRSRRPLADGGASSWDEFVSFWRTLHPRYVASAGAGLALVLHASHSPTMARLLRQFRQRFPQAVVVVHDPLGNAAALDGVELAAGKRLQPVYTLNKAQIILSLDCDFLSTEGELVRHAAEFADGRRLESELASMNRMYVVEARHSTTGASADHRLRLRASQIGPMLLALSRELGKHGIFVTGAEKDLSYNDNSGWVAPLAADLAASAGKAVVLVGNSQPAWVHALGVAINDALKSEAVAYYDTARGDAVLTQAPSRLKDLVEGRMGVIETAVVVGGNPVYDAPADVAVTDWLKGCANSIHISHYENETSRACRRHLNQAHFLEQWGDVRTSDGATISIIQPLISPLHDGVADIELLELLANGNKAAAYDLVRTTFAGILPKLSFESNWRQLLHDGVHVDSSVVAEKVSILGPQLAAAIPSRVDSGALELVLVPSQQVYDGRFANNGWLQETPDSVTKITWDNAACLSPATAAASGINKEDVIRLTVAGATLDLPAWIVPGQADDTIVLALGYGRTAAGGVGDNVGANANRLRSSDGLYLAPGAAIATTGATHPIASTQDHWSMENRPIIREADLDYYRHHPEFAQHMVHHPPLASMWDEHTYDKGYQWGMTIDLNTCVGCNACTIACQSENNIPVVGKVETRKGREMHWIRVDRYFNGDIKDPRMVHQPVNCQHCEMAPCEQVCPVAATVHDAEGLNAMVYNRCIGTRYCSNNCPYKVRRFNFFNFNYQTPELIKMAHNPEVTVRSRGVMEKCTYCVQRINRAKSTAKLEGRQVRDGEIVTACQQACPTDAIVFGNINDPQSRVAQVKLRNRNYNLLQELNVRPRTSYLAKIRNPNPHMPGVTMAGADTGGHH